MVLAAIFLAAVYALTSAFNLFRADAAFNGGEKARRLGLCQIAIEDYKRAIDLNPREPRYHRELAYCLASLGKIEPAVGEAEIAHRLNPKNSLTVRSLILTYVGLADVDLKYLTPAEKLIAETIAQQPTNPQLYYEQALILLKTGKDGEAVEALQRALSLKPDYQKVRELLESFRQSPS